MDSRGFIGRVFAVFAIVGLVAAPLALPAAAMGPFSMVMSDMVSMADEMPCCPDTQKKNDCKDCPLAANCAVSNLATRPVAIAIVHRPIKRLQVVARDDLMSDGLVRPPPDHPPRTSV